MFDELVAAFSDTLRNTDTLYLLPIYYAGGTASKDISSQDMAARLAGCNAEIFAPDNRDKALSAIAARAKHGDTIILMGARDPSLPAFAHLIASGIDSIKKEIRGHICNA
jgi:UDP-N-acetylmuramate--alanine ligase